MLGEIHPKLLSQLGCHINFCQFFALWFIHSSLGPPFPFPLSLPTFLFYIAIIWKPVFGTHTHIQTTTHTYSPKRFLNLHMFRTHTRPHSEGLSCSLTLSWDPWVGQAVAVNLLNKLNYVTVSPIFCSFGSPVSALELTFFGGF